MSVKTTQPGTLTSAPSTSDGWWPAGGAQNYPRDGAGIDGGQRIERRRNGSFGDSPMDILTHLPALVVLERLPVPTLGWCRSGVNRTPWLVGRCRPRVRTGACHDGSPQCR